MAIATLYVLSVFMGVGFGMLAQSLSRSPSRQARSNIGFSVWVISTCMLLGAVTVYWLR